MSNYFEDLRSVLQTSAGRNVLWQMLEQANVFGMSYTGDVNSTFFNEGARSMGNRLLIQIQQADAASFIKMQQEHLAKLEEEKRLKKTEHSD